MQKKTEKTQNANEKTIPTVFKWFDYIKTETLEELLKIGLDRESIDEKKKKKLIKMSLVSGRRKDTPGDKYSSKFKFIYPS